MENERREVRLMEKKVKQKQAQGMGKLYLFQDYDTCEYIKAILVNSVEDLDNVARFIDQEYYNRILADDSDTNFCKDTVYGTYNFISRLYNRIAFYKKTLDINTLGDIEKTMNGVGITLEIYIVDLFEWEMLELQKIKKENERCKKE